ncbi:hypothetical protein OQJ40_09190 [Serratia nevei]|uniref:hypothetical protein n=1 Tax=Serratia nevei TaxID=2703794 RepID=UPI0027D28E4D|nr:hypothetical protein [Serratia nevei]WMC77259.1 hypothetical protein O8I25_08970 [Serratia nevei]WMC82716.1 hypothetical protein O8I24_09190 [Serratia nevei]
MIKSIDFSDRSVTLVGLKGVVEDCQHILDSVNTSDKNSQNLIDAVKDKLAMVELELSGLQQRE